MERTRWYKDKVFYQIWPRSFKDGDGDGVGDLYGVLEKLDYIKSLGCDGIWFSPLYPSPNADMGYDISDYMDISREYGGMDTFKKVLDGAHARDMKVIMDLVVNHTSDEHEWFQKSRQRIDPYTDYYIWRPAKPDGSLPNNWDSNFEGKAWTWDETRGEYYLHLFAIKQPDLNMDNPLVREEVKKILKFWLDLGVDGFREDVITFISKEEGLPDDHLMPANKGILKYNHGPHIHDYLSEFRRDVLSNYDCMTLAEAPLISSKQALEYIAEPDGEMDMMIQFQNMCGDCLFSDWMPHPFSLRKYKRAIRDWQTRLHGKAWNMLYLENHDHPRIISRYGSEKFWEKSGKMLCAMYMFQQGTPFVYQGQEIGMLNWRPDDPDLYEDISTIYTYAHSHTHLPKDLRLKRCWRSSRDSARTPVQWSDKQNAGFTDGTPWMPVNENYTSINVAQQEQDPDSILNFYRKTIQLRKSLDVVRNGSYTEYLQQSPHFYVYERKTDSEQLVVIASFSDKTRTLRVPSSLALGNASLILSNYSDSESSRSIQMRPYEVRVYYLAK